ncbi:glucan-binding YG repeat protein [Clostridium beijerinckii]|nr:glucan-binding YG repeat protein [Clostridium beijerinckii]
MKKWYYLNGNGSMAANTTINGYTVDENGAWVQ